MVDRQRFGARLDGAWHGGCDVVHRQRLGARLVP